MDKLIFELIWQLWYCRGLQQLNSLSASDSHVRFIETHVSCHWKASHHAKCYPTIPINGLSLDCNTFNTRYIHMDFFQFTFRLRCNWCQYIPLNELSQSKNYISDWNGWFGPISSAWNGLKVINQSIHCLWTVIDSIQNTFTKVISSQKC